MEVLYLAKGHNIKASFNHISCSLETEVYHKVIDKEEDSVKEFELTFCNECKCYHFTSNRCKWCAFCCFAGEILQVLMFLSFQLSFLRCQAVLSSWLLHELLLSVECHSEHHEHKITSLLQNVPGPSLLESRRPVTASEKEVNDKCSPLRGDWGVLWWLRSAIVWKSSPAIKNRISRRPYKKFSVLEHLLNPMDGWFLLFVPSASEKWVGLLQCPGLCW